MRPEIFPHLLEFDVQSWTVLLYLASIGLGLYNGTMVYLREDRTAKARSAAISSAALWAIGGIVATKLWLLPNLIAPDAAKHGGKFDMPLHTYGFAIAIGFMLAISLSAHDAARGGIFPGESPPRSDEQRAKARNAVLDLAFWVLLSAIAGARLYFIAVNWAGPEGYGAHPENILKFWTGGLVFYGGFLGAVFASIVYARRHHINFLKLSDIAMPTISLGQFFGRLGCFAAGCCFGKEVPESLSGVGVRFPQGSLAWDTLVNQRHVLSPAAQWTPTLFPTQLIGGGGQLIIFLFLTYYLKPRKTFDGEILLTWLFLYPALRFADEFLRGDTERGVYSPLHISAGQITSLILMSVALGLLVWLKRPRGVSKSAALAT